MIRMAVKSVNDYEFYFFIKEKCESAFVFFFCDFKAFSVNVQFFTNANLSSSLRSSASIIASKRAGAFSRALGECASDPR